MKNKKKLLVLLLLLLLASATVVTTAFAKFTASGTGSHTAQVAKWGITVTGGTNTFLSTYNGSGDTSVAATDGTTLLVAPGTTGTLDLPQISGTAEVAVEVTATPTVSLSNWIVTEKVSDADKSVFYCPLVFTDGTTTVTGLDYYDTSADAETKQAAMEAAIKDLLPSKTGIEYAAGTTIATEVAIPTSITWTWAFSTEGHDGHDTQLGKADTKATVAISYEVKIEQIDTYSAS